MSDADFLAPDVQPPKFVSHGQWPQYLAELANYPGKRILEVGSRMIVGGSMRPMFEKAEYIGFDLYRDANVDVVGDAHRLSECFPNQQFDLIFSSACFEHFAAPWVVAKEITKLLKIGGHVFVETHFAFSSHERPWHFFHFTDLGLRALFGDGFECLDAGMSNVIIGHIGDTANEYLRGRAVPGMYTHAGYLGVKTREPNGATLDALDATRGQPYPRTEQREDLMASKIFDSYPTLEVVSEKIHDGAPIDQLHERAVSYLDFLESNAPQAFPTKPGAAILEIGGGVGWIMQAMHNRLVERNAAPRTIIDLDIAPHMLEKAAERLDDSVYDFCLYDGITAPLPDESIDLIYSVATLQHIPKAFVYNLLYEVKRLLKSDGCAVLHFPSFQLLSTREQQSPWRTEIDNQIHGRTAHWHFFYTERELCEVLDITGFSDFEVHDDGTGALIACVSP